MRTLLFKLVTIVWLGSDAGESFAKQPGSDVGALSFKDIRYLSRTLDDLPSKNGHVLFFHTNACPLARRYLPIVKELEKTYGPRGFVFVAINVGANETIREMAEHAIDYEITFPIVKDERAQVARRLGVDRVPTAVVLDSRRRLVYRGRVDDQYRLTGAQAAPKNRELRDALDAILAGRPIGRPVAIVEGCALAFPLSSAPSHTVTFASDIQPLLRKHCWACHGAIKQAPFSLLTYQDVVAHAQTIVEVVADQRMPPWYGSTRHGNFPNQRLVPAEERERFQQWVDAGMARGDTQKEIATSIEPTAASPWTIDPPDLVLRTLVAEKIPASGVIDYRYAVLPHVFTQETWIEQIEILPDNPAVVHHCNCGYFRLGEKVSNQNFITGRVPGGEPMKLRAPVAVRLPAGAMLGLQIHLVTTGKPEETRISVGLRFPRAPIQKQLRFLYLDDPKLTIAPGAYLSSAGASRTLQRDAMVVGLFAHMHLRGRDMTFRAHPPTGASQTLLVIPNYNFQWQHAYHYAPNQLLLSKGTRIECSAHYDNSAFNPFNPDPTITVRNGPQSFHEMMNGFFFYVDANESLNLTVDPKTGVKKAS